MKYLNTPVFYVKRIYQNIRWHDYLELCKLKVVMLMLLTSIIGMALATPEMIPVNIFLAGNLGIGLCASAGAVINHVVDRHLDILMGRTCNRPVASGRIDTIYALLFALIIGVLGMMILFFLVNALTAWLTLGALIGYAVVYTMFLKRLTPQNIVIGGLAGASPPLLGWVAVSGNFENYSLLLVLIIFAWTPPHFWALAIHRKNEYVKANVPMLPVTHGERYTKIHIMLYIIILSLVSLFPWITGLSGWIFLGSAVILNSRFIYIGWQLLRDSDSKLSIKTFYFSITYLMLLFLSLLIDHYVPIAYGGAG